MKSADDAPISPNIQFHRDRIGVASASFKRSEFSVDEPADGSPIRPDLYTTEAATGLPLLWLYRVVATIGGQDMQCSSVVRVSLGNGGTIRGKCKRAS
jgi:hypothetical protein